VSARERRIETTVRDCAVRQYAVYVPSLNACRNLRSGGVIAYSSGSNIVIVVINMCMFRPLNESVLVSWRGKREMFEAEAVVVHCNYLVRAAFARMCGCWRRAAIPINENTLAFKNICAS
jgi:hypothetical protein